MTNKDAIKILKPLFEQCKGTNGCLGYIEHYFSKDEEMALNIAIKALEERPQGEWIVEKNQFGDILYCSICGVRPRRSEYGTYLYDKFCNNCGADMRRKAAQNDTN